MRDFCSAASRSPLFVETVRDWVWIEGLTAPNPLQRMGRFPLSLLGLSGSWTAFGFQTSDGCVGVRARRHKGEIMKQVQCTTGVAGVDIGKRWLDVGFCHDEAHRRFANTTVGIAELIACMRKLGVGRIGMEASGNYEREVREALEAEGFAVVVFQPLEVKTFARWRRIRLKSDKADAHLIALATQAYEGVSARRDPELIELAELLTVYEQASDLLATIKTQAEHDRLTDVIALRDEMKAALSQTKKRALVLLLHRVRLRPDWLKRFDLLRSLPGVGQVVALALLIRMPELGEMKPGQPAALLGVAPFDRDSGTLKGKRFITGGRARPRTLVYIAALAAKRMNNAFKAFAKRLIDAGKPPKVAIVAVMRKLIEAANLILKRQSPWINA